MNTLNINTELVIGFFVVLFTGYLAQVAFVDAPVKELERNSFRLGCIQVGIDPHDVCDKKAIEYIRSKHK
jgi:hypothetical protein